MDDERMNDKRIRHKVRDSIKELIAPIDFETLEAQGLLKKEGTWYRTNSLDKLPSYVRKRITTFKEDGKGGGLVRFKSDKPYQNMRDRLR